MKSIDDPRSTELKHLRIEPVEVSRVRLNSASADMREVRVSLSRVKFGETGGHATKGLTTRPIPKPPRLKPGADPQKSRLRNSNRTGKTKWS
jgi:hypothetical protein